MNWNQLPPTQNQLNAIKSYNQAYGVNIIINNKQDAHNVISVFCPVQKLEFDGFYVKGTTVGYSVTNEKLFNCYKTLNYNRLKNVKNIEIKDGIAKITIAKKNNTLNMLESLNNNMSRMLTEQSFSDYEDSLGYLDEDGLDRESDLYGNDPKWWE